MVKVEFPVPNFKIKEEDGKELIFDEIRRKWVKLTPEEWVRQNFVQYLVQAKQYPAAFISIEKEIQLGELKKRFDVLIYNRNHEPWMMVECKSLDVELSADVLAQVVRYNTSVPVSFLVITNGSYTYVYEKKLNALQALSFLPDFLK
ncbi:MAG: type I restriction enzyme HsdR N-terminal domain-containing protein [Chitinophagaceae bacterium]|nr:type I restriction enzyme HsdR N-terminal domain-containing protein [Chitinophagaceae bacterium]